MMKKIVIIALFFGMVCQTSLAQVEGDVRFGFQLSPTFSWMSANINQINPSGTAIGVKLGMLGEYFFSDNYAVTFGLGFAFNSGGTLLYEEAGQYWTQSDVPDEAFSDPTTKTFPAMSKLQYNLQFVELPIGLKLKTGDDVSKGSFGYFLEPSLAIGIRTQARGTIDGAGSDAEKINIRDEVNLLNLSWGIGGGVEYGLSDQTSLIGGLGLQFGFADITDDSGTRFEDNNAAQSVAEDSKGVINAFVLKLGIMF